MPVPNTNPYTLMPVSKPGYFVASRNGRGTQAGRLLRNLCRTDPPPDNLSLVGERRCGKTSLLGYLRAAATGTPGLCLVSVDLLGLRPQTSEGFYAMLTRALVRAGELQAGTATLNSFAFDDFLEAFARAGRRLILFVSAGRLNAASLGQNSQPGIGWG
jgi:hypothetical protein